jgi:drug/metabolite transporter (DMT)-like permease
MEMALALAAALFFALGTVLQQRVASAASAEEAAKLGFLLRLARQPVWLAGIASDAAGFVCHAGALAAGRLVVVQPILATSLVFALPIGAWLDKRRVSARELLGAAAVAAGLAVFLIVADPPAGSTDPSGRAWILAFIGCGAACAAFVMLSRRSTSGRRAALLGSAAGVLFGLCAALIKSTVERLDGGLIHVVADWHVWALVVVGYASMALSERSFQAGPLAPALATQTALDPTTSLALGVFAFNERIHETAVGTVGALGGMALMIAGIVVLVGGARGWQDVVPAAAALDPASPGSSTNIAM